MMFKKNIYFLDDYAISPSVTYEINVTNISNSLMEYINQSFSLNKDNQNKS